MVTLNVKGDVFLRNATKWAISPNFGKPGHSSSGAFDMGNCGQVHSGSFRFVRRVVCELGLQRPKQKF